MAHQHETVMREAAVQLVGAMVAMSFFVAVVTAGAYFGLQFAGWWIALSAAILGQCWLGLNFGREVARWSAPTAAVLLGAALIVGLCLGWGLRRLVLCV